LGSNATRERPVAAQQAVGAQLPHLLARSSIARRKRIVDVVGQDEPGTRPLTR
jgi:hypothetical protein